MTQRVNVADAAGMSAGEREALVVLADVIVAYAGDFTLPDLLRVTRAREVAAAVEAFAAAVRTGVVIEEPGWEYGEQSRFFPETVWIVDPDAQALIWADIPEERRVRRRKAGPWIPVEQGGDA